MLEGMRNRLSRGDTRAVKQKAEQKNNGRHAVGRPCISQGRAELSGRLNAMAQHLDRLGSSGNPSFIFLGFRDPADVFLAMGKTQLFKPGEQAFLLEGCFESRRNLDRADRFVSVRPLR